jgi:hypothetical protein
VLFLIVASVIPAWGVAQIPPAPTVDVPLAPPTLDELSPDSFRTLQTPQPPPAGQKPQPAPQPGRPTQRPTPLPTPEATPVPLPIPPTVRGKELNVQIELTINDQSGAGPGQKKTVSLLAADRTMGRVRASADASKENVGRVGTNLFIDARPIILDGNSRILLELALEYTPLVGMVEAARSPTHLNESISVILADGKPLTISQAADPISDRRMTVEVKATILK